MNIDGCGFLKYEVSTTDSSYLTYAYSSASCDNNLAACLFVDVNTAVEASLSFNLRAVGFDSRSVSVWKPYTVWVTDCLDSVALSWASIPDLVVDKSPISGNTLTYNMNPTYLNYVSHTPTTPSCGPWVYDLVEATSPYNTLSRSDIVMTYKTEPASTYFTVQNDADLWVTVKFKATSIVETFAYGDMFIRVCGIESLRLTTDAKRIWMLQYESGSAYSMADATRYTTIDETTFSAYFYIDPVGDVCTVKMYELLESEAPDTVWTSNSKVDLVGSFGSHQLKFDKT